MFTVFDGGFIDVFLQIPPSLGSPCPPLLTFQSEIKDFTVRSVNGKILE